jgi:phosphate starvation-inducible PhoH-like protein
MAKTKGDTTPFRPLKLREFDPKTLSQEKVYESYKKGKHLCLSGCAGTGKTFIAMYLALKEIFEKTSSREKVVVVRSIVPTRDIGFLPGDVNEKEASYLKPYIGIATELFGESKAFTQLVGNRQLEFLTTSFVRGITIRDSIVIVDEFQNCVGRELDSVLTRLSDNCRVILCGDLKQTDFDKLNERSGAYEILRILESMKDFENIEFGWHDIVRSGFVRDYLMTKDMLNISF